MGSIHDIAKVAELSAVVNHAQLVGEYDGSIHVPMYEFTIQTALKGISQMHQFRFTAAYTGVIFVKISCDYPVECKIKLLKSVTWEPRPENLPAQIIPQGLTFERQWYLYQKIHDYCPDNVKDIVCPQPSTPLP